MFNIDEYFARIGFVHRESEDRTQQFIRLHRCHSLAVPFEDFNPFCGLAVSLDIQDIFEKVVSDRRGGYCFELNLLFQRREEAAADPSAEYCTTGRPAVGC